MAIKFGDQSVPNSSPSRLSSEENAWKIRGSTFRRLGGEEVTVAVSADFRGIQYLVSPLQ